jgi:tetratricopeptide (TPR) repeat protein
LGGELMTNLERLAHSTGAWGELCSAIDAAAEGLREDDPKREELTLRAAKWYWDRLTNPSAAEQRYNWVFARDPAASPAFRALEAIYTAVLAENPEKLLDLYRRRLAVVRAKEERAQLLKRSAYLNADFLVRDDDAVLAYEEALRLTPDDAEILEALAPLYEKTKRFNDLCRILGRQLDRARSPEDKFVLLRRLAEVYGAELNDDGEAIRNYRAALEIVPNDIELWRALRWHCNRAHRWPELAEALRAELGLAEDPIDRVTIARDLAQIEEERLGHPREAADALSIVMEIETDDDVAAVKYEQLLETVERWNELALFYDKRLGATLPAPERVRILGALATIAEKHLADPGRAAAALAQRCELKPDDLAALRELARIYDQQGRWKECFEFLKAQVKRLGEIGDVAVELLCRMGQLCEERANNIEVAEKCYKRALSIDGKSGFALDGLKRVYKHRKEPGLVAQVLQAQEALAEGEARAELATERGRTLRDDVGDLAGAAAAFEAALEASPLHADAAIGLVELAEKGVATDKLRAHLTRLIEVFAKTRRIRERHLVLHKLGLFAEGAGDGPRAIAAYEAAYQAASTHLPTLLSLARLYYDAGHWEKALKMLQILLLNEGSLPSAADRVELFYRLGAIRQKMGERARAINMFQRALEIDASHAASRKALQDILGT